MTATHADLVSRSRRDFGSLQMREVPLVEVAVDANAAATRLSKAITFPTVSNQDRADFDAGAFDGFHRYLLETFPLVHGALEREVLGRPRRASLLYTWRGENSALTPIVLMAHQDVVPVVPGTESLWEHDAFSGAIADGYVWGRGTLDDKIMIMAVLEAIEMHLRAGFQPSRTIYLVFGQDEEVMGLEGAQQIVAELRSRGIDEVALVLDEGLPLAPGLFPGISQPIALIGTAEKGYATLQLKVAGVGGHSAMPPSHSNIGILAQAITKLEANPFPYRITQAVRDQFRFLGPELPAQYHRLLADVVYGDAEPVKGGGAGDEQAAGYTNSAVAGWTDGKNSADQFVSYMLSAAQTTAMMHTTTAVTMVDGGIKENVMPPFASAMVNLRILQGETVDSVTERAQTVIDDDRVEVTALPTRIDPSPVSDPYGKEYKLIETSIRKTWGTPDLLVSPYLMIGGADAKYFATTIAKNVFRFTAVRVESAADASRWHGVNERVLIGEYAKSIGFFHNFISSAQQL
jgi:carboxypeptidase PM20D1